MQRSITKISSGLLYKDDFTSLSTWTNDGSWTNPNSPAFISFGALQKNPFSHGTTFDKEGAREPNPFIDDDGTYYMLYDGGNGSTGWTSFIARSYDRGATWEKLGQMPPGYSNGTGGTWAANAMGYLTKFNGKYYYYRVLAGTFFAPPNIGLPGVPYSGDVWESTSLLNGWVFKGILPKVVGTWTRDENLPCSTVKSGGNYYLFTEGSGVGATSYQIGILSSSTPYGTWTQQNPAVLNTNILGDGRYPENAKIFFHPQINKWVMLVNLIAAAADVTDQNFIMLSDSLTDWSAARSWRLHRICPMDGAHAIGVVAPINIPEGTYILPNGDVPIYYDTNPERYAGNGWHQGRKLEGSVMQLSTNALKFESGTTGITRNITHNITHTDFVAEFGVQFSNNSVGTNVTFSYRGTGGNSYKLTIRNSEWLLLQKITGGVPTTLFAATSGISTLNNYISRIKISVQGNIHKAYIDGELQINITDGTFSGGSFIAFGGYNASNAEIREFTMRKSDVVTVQGTPENKQVNLRQSFGMLTASGNTASNGVASVVSYHYPMDMINVNGVDFLASEEIWGGDVLTIPVVNSPLNDQNNSAGSTSRKALDGIGGATSPSVMKVLS